MLMMLAALAVLAVPASGMAAPKTTKADRQAAKATCKAERKADKKAFKAKYHGFSRCVHKEAKANAKERRQAEKACREERTTDPAAFKETYGTNHNKKNAFGKCVSQKVREDSGEDGDGEDGGS
jgi:hypothetical protein